MHSHSLILSLSLCLSRFNPREMQETWSVYGYNPLMDSKLITLSVDPLTFYGFARLILNSPFTFCLALTEFSSHLLKATKTSSYSMLLHNHAGGSDG